MSKKQNVRAFSVVQEGKVAPAVEISSRFGQTTAIFGSFKWCLWQKKECDYQYKNGHLPYIGYASFTLWI